MTMGGGWGGWIWWYRSNFVIPGNWVVAKPSGEFALFGVSEAGAHWVLSARSKLLDWKARRIFANLDWGGRRWVDEKTGLTAEFTEPGQFRWVVFPEELEKRYHSKKIIALLKELEGRRVPLGEARNNYNWVNDDLEAEVVFYPMQVQPPISYQGISVTLSTDGTKLFLRIRNHHNPAFTFIRQTSPPSRKK